MLMLAHDFLKTTLNKQSLFCYYDKSILTVSVLMTMCWFISNIGFCLSIQLIMANNLPIMIHRL